MGENLKMQNSLQEDGWSLLEALRLDLKLEPLENKNVEEILKKGMPQNGRKYKSKGENDKMKKALNLLNIKNTELILENKKLKKKYNSKAEELKGLAEEIDRNREIMKLQGERIKNQKTCHSFFCARSSEIPSESYSFESKKEEDLHSLENGVAESSNVKMSQKEVSKFKPVQNGFNKANGETNYFRNLKIVLNKLCKRRGERLLGINAASLNEESSQTKLSSFIESSETKGKSGSIKPIKEDEIKVENGKKINSKLSKKKKKSRRNRRKDNEITDEWPEPPNKRNVKKSPWWLICSKTEGEMSH